jgi:hypothetical protein
MFVLLYGDVLVEKQKKVKEKEKIKKKNERILDCYRTISTDSDLVYTFREFFSAIVIQINLL